MDIDDLYETDTYSTSPPENQDIFDDNAVANIATTSSNTISGVPIILNKGKSKPGTSPVKPFFSQKPCANILTLNIQVGIHANHHQVNSFFHLYLKPFLLFQANRLLIYFNILTLILTYPLVKL